MLPYSFIKLSLKFPDKEMNYTDPGSRRHNTEGRTTKPVQPFEEIPRWGHAKEVLPAVTVHGLVDIACPALYKPSHASQKFTSFTPSRIAVAPCSGPSLPSPLFRGTWEREACYVTHISVHVFRRPTGSNWCWHSRTSIYIGLFRSLSCAAWTHVATNCHTKGQPSRARRPIFLLDRTALKEMLSDFPDNTRISYTNVMARLQSNPDMRMVVPKPCLGIPKMCSMQLMY
jgi:hypothetical protein